MQYENERELRKKNIKEMKENLTCIEIATNLFGLNMERSRSNARYLKPIEHSSMVFDLKENIVYWNAKSTVPYNVIDFYMAYTGKPPYECINELLNYYHERNPLSVEHYVYNETENETYIQKGLILPDKAADNHLATDYLINHRKIDDKLVWELQRNNQLYEDVYHNAVFIGYDVSSQTVPVFAIRRGTGQQKFQRDCAGSQKYNGFYISRTVNEDENDKLYVFESVIDGLSFMTLNKEKNMKILCSSGCGSVLNMLKYNLVNNPDLQKIKHIELLLDNDEAGKVATENIIKQLDEKQFTWNGKEYPVFFDITDTKYCLNYHDEKREVKDLNELLQAVTYLQENEIQSKDESLVI